jgi:hypothetical protein
MAAIGHISIAAASQQNTERGRKEKRKDLDDIQHPGA